MSELKAAIEAAGLPAPDIEEPFYARWEDACIEISGMGTNPMQWSADRWDDFGQHYGIYPFHAPAEACATVRRWMDEQ